MIWHTNMKTIAIILILSASVCCAEGRDTCFICNKPVYEAGTHVMYRGLLHPTHGGNCLRKWENALRENQLDPLVFKIEPRGALFQGDSRFLNTVFQKAHPISDQWMWMGVGILVAIVSGGVSAALAIVSYRSALSAFTVGFLLPGIGILIIRLLPKKSGKFGLRGTKIATTFDVVNCPECNYPSHPASESCINCAASLTPMSESEVLKVKTS